MSPLERFWSTAQLLARVPAERRLPYLPTEAIRQRRDARVRALVRYAAAHVPYYRDLFDGLRIDPGDIRGADDLDLLPILDKSTLRAEPLRFVARTARADDHLELVTSGTTGHPVPIRHDRRSLKDNLLHTEPEKEVVRSLAGRLPRRRMSIMSPRSNAMRIAGFHGRSSFVPTGAGHHRLSTTQPMEEIFAAINAHRPKVLMSYGSYLELLFRTAIAHGIELHGPPVVIYGADELSEPGRRLIEERFGSKVLSRYGAIECLRIGFTCERGFGFHIRDDLCPLKLTDERGERVPPGQPGQVVISNLVNHGTVLLNYRLGDVAIQSEEVCACGRTLTVLNQISGRRDDALFLTDGRVLHSMVVRQIFRDQLDLIQSQIVQHAPDRFEVRLVPAEPAAFDRLVPRLEADLLAVLGPSVRLEFERVPEFQTDGRTKFRSVVSHCAPPEFETAR
jgi:phenylacetate-CoA ligase